MFAFSRSTEAFPLPIQAGLFVSVCNNALLHLFVWYGVLSFMILVQFSCLELGAWTSDFDTVTDSLM
jgi:hypothetical protein